MNGIPTYYWFQLANESRMTFWDDHGVAHAVARAQAIAESNGSRVVEMKEIRQLAPVA